MYILRTAVLLSMRQMADSVVVTGNLIYTVLMMNLLQFYF